MASSSQNKISESSLWDAFKVPDENQRTKPNGKFIANWLVAKTNPDHNDQGIQLKNDQFIKTFKKLSFQQRVVHSDRHNIKLLTVNDPFSLLGNETTNILQIETTTERISLVITHDGKLIKNANDVDELKADRQHDFDDVNDAYEMYLYSRDWQDDSADDWLDYLSEEDLVNLDNHLDR